MGLEARTQEHRIRTFAYVRFFCHRDTENNEKPFYTSLRQAYFKRSIELIVSFPRILKRWKSHLRSNVFFISVEGRDQCAVV